MSKLDLDNLFDDGSTDFQVVDVVEESYLDGYSDGVKAAVALVRRAASQCEKGGTLGYGELLALASQLGLLAQ